MIYLSILRILYYLFQDVLGNADGIIYYEYKQNKLENIVQEDAIWLMIIVVVATCIFLFKFISFLQVNINNYKRKNVVMNQNVCQIQILPWGVQINEYHRKYNITMNQIGEQTIQKERRRKLRREFIPMEHIVDVIVVERVMSYRVQSCILFRINEKGACSTMQCMDKNYESEHDDRNKRDDETSSMFVKSDETRNSDISLMEVFSSKMVELSYSESIKIWKEMCDVLDKYQSMQ